MEKLRMFDIALVSLSLVALMVVVGYARPMVIAPLDDYESLDGEVLFEIAKADVLLIDDNVEFSSPDEYFVEEGLRIRLVPGNYYWKAVGLLGSEVRSLTIQSEVNLEFVDTGDGFGVVNSGNVPLNVDVYNGSELVDRVRLEVGSELEGDGDKFVGGVA